MPLTVPERLGFVFNGFRAPFRPDSFRTLNKTEIEIRRKINLRKESHVGFSRHHTSHIIQSQPRNKYVAT